MVASASSLKAQSVHMMDTVMANDTHAGHPGEDDTLLGKGIVVPDKVFPLFSYLAPLELDMKSGSPAAIC